MEQKNIILQEQNTIGTPPEQPKGSRKKRWLTGAVLCVLVCSVGAAVLSYHVASPLLPAKSGYIHVQSDMSAQDIADTLKAEGFIQSTTWFRIVAKVTGQDNSLKEGEYIMDSHMSLQQMLGKLTSGKSEAARLVIPEGYTVWQIAKAVAQLGTISEADFLAAAKDTSQLYPYMQGNRSNVTFPTEGFLFPDTYFIPNNATAQDVVAMMLRNFDHRLTPAMKEKIAAKHLSIYQFVTLASLVEKEAKFDADRPLIASVFLNRLQTHMKLQSDASISYAMGSHKAAYSIAETQYDSPYNTYMYEGLPPGAIGNPGLDSMNAILDAPQTSYLYFVADGEGHNYFATTYEDHMKNVEAHMP